MAAIANYPRFRAVDDDNAPLVGGWVYAYEPGTSTPKDTYTDHTLGTAHTNPIELDANGEETIFIDGNTDFVLEDAAHVQRWGPIRALDLSSGGTLTNATLAGTLTVSSTAVTWSGNPTHSGNHTFTQNVTVNGNTTLGNASSDTLTVNADTLDFANGVAVSGNVEFQDELTFGAPTGTWSPGLTFGGASTGITYSNNRHGVYWRVGPLYFISLRLIITNKGSSTGSARITGLPITPTGTVGLAQFPLSVSATGMSGLTGAVFTSATDGSALLSLFQSAATSTESALTDANFTNTSDIHVSGFFRA